MSQENLELAERAIRAATARPKPDYETVNALYSEAHELVPAGAASGVEEEGRGVDGYRAWRDGLESAGAIEHVFVSAVDLGPEKVLAVTVARLVGRTSGTPAEQRIWSVVTIRNRKITRTEAFTDARSALAACLRD